MSMFLNIDEIQEGAKNLSISNLNRLIRVVKALRMITVDTATLSMDTSAGFPKIGGKRGSSTAGLDLSRVHLGFSLSGGSIKLNAGYVKIHGRGKLAVASSTKSLGGAQFFYVHHLRSSAVASWEVAAVEPVVSSDSLDICFYEFLNGSIVQTDGVDTGYHRYGGSIDLDSPAG